MADNSDSKESDNNSWVIAGSEALPVEELRMETMEETLVEAELARDGSSVPPPDSKMSSDHPEPQEAKHKDPRVVLVPSSCPAKPSEPTHVERETPSPSLKELSPHDIEATFAPVPEDTVIIHKEGPLEGPVSTSSSEEEATAEHDVEGLRRRKGRDVTPAPPSQESRREAPENEDRGLSKTKWLLGLLAFLGLGFLAFSGGLFDLEEGPVDTLRAWSSSEGEEMHPGSNGKDRPTSTPPEARRGAKVQQSKGRLPSETSTEPQSLDAMGVLLDKLAKENQEIRLMQAELLTQKEELQGLLRKTEGEALEFTSQQKDLAVENSRLRESLQKETSALLAVQTELRVLQEKLRGMASKADDAKLQQHRGEEATAEQHQDQAERPVPEAHRLRSLLESVHRNLARAVRKTPPGNGAEGLRTELDAVQKTLAQELEHSRGGKQSWREVHKAKRSKKTHPKLHEGQEGQWPGHPKTSHTREPRGAHKSPKAPEDGPHPPRKHQGPGDAKSGKERETQSGGRKASKPARPSALWEMLTRHHFRPPQGCAGIAECAQQEGLAPVRKTGFLQMVQAFLAALGWGEHYRALEAALEGFFDGDGVFAHNRTSFTDFLDEVEDVLEDLAQQLGVSKEAVDDFEEAVLRQLEAAPAGRFTQRDGTQWNRKEDPREGRGRRNGREGSHRGRG